MPEHSSPIWIRVTSGLGSEYFVILTSSGSRSSLSSSSSFSDRFLFCSSVSFFSPLNWNCYWVWKWMVLHRGCQKVLNDNIGLVFIRPRPMCLCLMGGVMVLVLVVRLQMNIWSLLSRGRRSRTAREALTLLRISTRPLMKQKNDTIASWNLYHFQNSKYGWCK